MKINLYALKVLELKLAEFSTVNGSIAEYKSSNSNRCNGCTGNCYGLCAVGCTGSNMTNLPQSPGS